MTKLLLRNKAIQLRQQGYTYSEIKRYLQIPKSTLSNWLCDYPLSNEENRLLNTSIKRNKLLSIEKIRNTKRNKRVARLDRIYQTEKNRLVPMSIEQMEIAGLFLYWGEGSKYMKGPVSICNTDPQVIKFSMNWLTSCYRTPREKIRVYLHLYSDMNQAETVSFWSNELSIPIDQFSKPYIKKSKRSEVDQKGFGHGTCTIVISDIRLKEKIMMGIKSIADYYSSNALPML